MTQVKNIRGRAVTFHTGSTTAAVNWPDPIESGDRVLLFCSGRDNGTNTFDPGTGWTALDSTIGSGTGVTFQAWEKDDPATGSESGTFNVTVNTTRGFNFITMAIRDTSGSTEYGQTSGGSPNADSPEVVPSGGSGFYVQIAVGAIDATSVTDWPDEFDEWLSSSGDSSFLMSAERESVESTVDPGSWSHANTGWCAATVVIPASAPAEGSFPEADTTDYAESDWTTGATTQDMNLPSTTTDMWVAVVSVRPGNESISGVAGFTEVTQAAETSDNRVGIFYREPDGGEGATAEVTFSGNVQGTAVVIPVDGATANDIEAATATFDSATADPPSLTPAGGAAQILWLTGFGQRGNGTPQNMPLNVGAGAVRVLNGGGLAPAYLAASLAASETATLDPGSITTTQSSGGVAFTVAIYPSASPPPPPTPSGNRMGGTGAIRKPPRTPR